jgi:uncharacterized coiled-coil protein SlyX
MAKMPTHEELEQRIQELEKRAVERKKEKETVMDAMVEKESILNSLVEHVIHQDTELRVLLWRPWILPGSSGPKIYFSIFLKC